MSPVPDDTPPPKKVEVTEKKVEQKGNVQSNAAKKELPQTRASEVRAKPTKVDRPKKFTSTKQGGAVKLGEKAGANAQSAKDVTKEGLLSAFGGGGVRNKLDQAYSGTGELLGMADKATGSSGQNESRAGDDIGSKFKDTGAGGKGTATQGIAGIGTKGRGSGQSAYGESGLGGKGNVSIDVGGTEAGFVGTIDKEAVRRVIRSILNQIKSCYERQLRTKSDLEGKIVINFDIQEQGRVSKAVPKEASPEMRQVAECVAARIREQRFPDPPKGSFASVDYPFVFGKQ
jgi:outer membrane biosynthesis protein TonB